MSHIHSAELLISPAFRVIHNQKHHKQLIYFSSISWFSYVSTVVNHRIKQNTIYIVYFCKLSLLIGGLVDVS